MILLILGLLFLLIAVIMKIIDKKLDIPRYKYDPLTREEFENLMYVDNWNYESLKDNQKKI